MTPEEWKFIGNLLMGIAFYAMWLLLCHIILKDERKIRERREGWGLEPD
jgi:hypothetical protein